MAILSELFKSSVKPIPAIDAPLAKHIQWIADNIYSQPFPGSRGDEGIHRSIHGVSHVTRAVIWLFVIINFRALQRDEQIDSLNEEMILLAAIAVMLHDSGCEHDGKDELDRDSAANIYLYLTTAGVDIKSATKIAEAMANKNVEEPFIYELQIEDGKISWKQQPIDSDSYEKNILQKIIHDADSLDYIRLPSFDYQHLDICREFVGDSDADSPQFNLLSEILITARHFVHTQGDCFLDVDSKKKERYEFSVACYEEQKDLLRLPKFKILRALFNEGRRFNERPTISTLLPDTSALDEMQCLFKEHRLITRGITGPTFLNRSQREKRCGELELEKLKEDNLDRSVSLASTTPPFAPSGFIFPLMPGKIGQVSTIDFNTGHSIKAGLLLPQQAIPDELRALIRKARLGRMTRAFDSITHSYHTELLVLLNSVDCKGIFYCNDPCFQNQSRFHMDSGRPYHPNTPLLEAIYLKLLYKKMFGKDLPIFKLSYLTFSLEHQEHSIENMIKMWEECIRDYISLQLANKSHAKVVNLSLENLKIAALYGLESTYDLDAYFTDKPSMSDGIYPPEVTSMLNERIEQIRSSLLENSKTELMKKYASAERTILSEEEYTEFEALLALCSSKDIEDNPSIRGKIQFDKKTLSLIKRVGASDLPETTLKIMLQSTRRRTGSLDIPDETVLLILNICRVTSGSRIIRLYQLLLKTQLFSAHNFTQQQFVEAVRKLYLLITQARLFYTMGVDYNEKEQLILLNQKFPLIDPNFEAILEEFLRVHFDNIKNSIFEPKTLGGREYCFVRFRFLLETVESINRVELFKERLREFYRQLLSQENINLLECYAFHVNLAMIPKLRMLYTDREIQELITIFFLRLPKNRTLSKIKATEARGLLVRYLEQLNTLFNEFDFFDIRLIEACLLFEYHSSFGEYLEPVPFPHIFKNNPLKIST